MKGRVSRSEIVRRLLLAMVMWIGDGTSDSTRI
jgi:hypothetical protein